MPALVIHFDDAEKAAVQNAAKLAHLTQTEFCRRAILAEASHGAGAELLGMVRAIYAATCNGRKWARREAATPPTPAPMDADATACAAALVQMGMKNDEARGRAERARATDAAADAAGLIRLALAGKATNGTP